MRAKGVFLEEAGETLDEFKRENVLRYAKANEQDSFEDGINQGFLLALKLLDSPKYGISRAYDERVKRSRSASDRSVGVSVKTIGGTLAKEFEDYINN